MITITLRPAYRLSMPLGLDNLKVILDDEANVELALTISRVLVGPANSGQNTQLKTIDW